MDKNGSVIQHNDWNTEIHIINDKMVRENISGIVFISLLMIVGIPGNIIALLVYLQKLKPSTYKIFVVCVALVDLAACCISMPFAIVRLRYPVLFPHDEVCKVFFVLSHIPCVSSVFILITIAVERYRIICVPYGTQMSERMAKYICIIDILVACCLSSPVAVIYGKRSYKLELDYINGSSCSVSDNMVSTNYPKYFFVSFGFILFASIMALTIIYSLIGRQICRMKKIGLGRNQLQSCHNCTVRTQTVDIDSGQGNQTNEHLDCSKREYCSFELDAIKKWGKMYYKTIRITRIIIVITVVFACTFLPYVCFCIMTALDFENPFLNNSSFPVIVAYHMSKWTIFISNVVNPIIYGFCDRRFKEEICRLYKSFCGICLTKT